MKNIMNKYKSETFTFSLVFALAGCLLSCIACSKIKTPDAKLERETWIESFSDSIKVYQEKRDLVESGIQELNAIISKLIDNFEQVKKPREVTGYYLLKGWQSKIPFTTTGIYARINENGKLELIATLSGATFNQLKIANTSVASEIVPHDQAFNYRHERFNTVYFSGEQANEIARYIAENSGHKISLEFLEGKVKKNFILPDDEKTMISQTWKLYSNQIEANRLQREYSLYSRKIDTFRRFMIENESPSQN